MASLAKPKIYGAVTVGERGQVVIPADIRKAINIRAGDKLIVFAKHDMVSLIPAEAFNQFINQATEVVAKMKH